MQHDHVLKRLNFDLLTPWVEEGLLAKYSLPCCCIRDSLLKFDMQRDHVLKMLNFDPTPRVQVGVVGGRLQTNYLLSCCCIHDSLSFDMQHDHILKKS